MSQLLGLGNNEFGQLAQKHVVKERDGFFSTAQIIKLDDHSVDSQNDSKVVSVAAGREFSAVLTDKGHVYTFGGNYCGQLGQGDAVTTVCVPKRILLPSVFIKQVVCGAFHMVLLSDGGDVYTCGDNQYGQLGHDSGCTRRYKVPTMVSKEFLPSSIQQVTAGRDHTLALSVDGNVYSFGCGRYGQLGHGEYDSSARAAQVIGLPRNSAIQVSAGCYHSVILTDCGVFTFGHNEYGQLGHDSLQEFCNVATKVQASQHLKISLLSAGGHRTAFVTECGSLYTCGNNEFGQLGHHTDKIRVRQPELVKSLHKAGIVVSQVSCGFEHTILVSDTGLVYTMGCKQGENQGNTCLPRLLESDLLQDTRALQVAAGSGHSLILTEDTKAQYENNMVAMLQSHNFHNLSLALKKDYHKFFTKKKLRKY